MNWNLVLGGSRIASVGDEIVVSVKKARPLQLSSDVSSKGSSGAISKLKKGDVARALVVRCHKEVRREDGSYCKFDDNAVVMLNKQSNNMYSQLQSLVQAEDFEGIINLTNNLDEEFKDQPDILRSRAVALIRMEKYEEALRFIQRSKAGMELVFEEAYCCYRLNKLVDSLSLLNNALEELQKINCRNTLVDHLSHLKAQVCYRLEQFDESLSIYKNMPADEDIESNIIAVEAVKLACTKTSTFDTSSRPSSYSGLFNYALYQLSLGNHELKAIDTLDEAAQLCSNQMSIEGYDDAAIEKELLVISSQKAYALQLIGLKKEALELYEKLLSSTSLDPTILAIASNNIQVLKGASDVLNVSKALKLIHTPSIIAKLNSSQIFLIEFNGLIYSILVGKNSVAANKLHQLKGKISAQDPRMDWLLVLEGNMLIKQNKSTVKDMENFVTSNPQSIACHLFLLDALLKSNNLHAVETHAMKLLHDASFTKYRPAILSLLVWIFEKGERHHMALEILEKYGLNSVSKAFDELHQLSEFKIKLGRYSEAKADLEKIFNDFPDRKTVKLEALYLYCIAHLGGNHKHDLKQYMEILEPKCMLELDSFVENLEQLPRIPKPDKEEKKKKKKRPKPLPKNYDPEKIPDPERWIPKRMRKNTAVKKEKEKGPTQETSGFGFQGAVLEGGGIGSTGSARIAGFKLPVSPVAVESKEEPSKTATQKFPPAKNSKGKKKK